MPVPWLNLFSACWETNSLHIPLRDIVSLDFDGFEARVIITTWQRIETLCVLARYSSAYGDVVMDNYYQLCSGESVWSCGTWQVAYSGHLVTSDLQFGFKARRSTNMCSNRQFHHILTIVVLYSVLCWKLKNRQGPGKITGLIMFHLGCQIKI